jgi:phage-related minor tail protein
MGVMGEAGPEAIMPLKRNSQGRLGVEASPTNITIINNAGAEVQTSEVTNSDGSKQIDILIERKVKDMFGSGSMDKSMRSSYGLTRAAT